MKKMLSFLIACLMMFSQSVPVLASEMAPIYKIDSADVKPLHLTLIDQRITPCGRVEV